MKLSKLLIANYYLCVFCLLMVSSCTSATPPEPPPVVVVVPEGFENIKSTNPEKGLVTGRIYDEIATNPARITDFKNLGIKWLRIEFEEYINLPIGTSVESTVVKANIVKFKKVIELAHNNGIKILGVISLNSSTEKEVPLSAEKIVRYTNSVEWHLNTYSIDAIEVWNEPFGFGFTPKTNLKWYGSTLINVYDQLKPKFPTVLFVGPATANAEAGEWIGRHDWQNPGLIEGENSIFNTKVMRDWRAAHAGKLPLDIFSWHTYGAGNADPIGDFYFSRTFKTYYQEIANYKDLDGRSIVGNNPIWFTEFGWSSTTVGEDAQRNNYDAIMDAFETLPLVEKVFMYDYKDDENVAGSEGNAHGLIKNSTNGFALKPIYYSFLSRSAGVGLMLINLKHAPKSEVVKKYLALGGFEVLGSPVFSAYNKSTQGYLYSLSSGLLVQHFLKYKTTPVAITYDNATTKSFFIPEQFYAYYFTNNEVLNKPKGDAALVDGVLVQQFDGGTLKWINNAVVYSK